jgi:hypothetical protein
MYDVKTVEIASHVRSAVSTVAHQPLEILTQVSATPQFKPSATSELLGIVK